ncbi:MAG: VWA domain-containing protein [Hyphomonadaceae bacterium]|nr:VWA domain-containing protein [Hyphomonadaceae bacterium]
MRSRRRNTSVFSISALDLFAAALGAFILIVLVLFPYYQMGGTDVSMEELEEFVQKRRMAAATTQTEMAQIRAIRAEIRLLDKQYRTTEENMSKIQDTILEVQKQTAEIEIPDPPPIPRPVPVPDPIPEPPRSVGRGVEFSILGLATSKKKIAIVVDMSGSMRAHTDKVTDALNEIVSQMKPDNQFVILGYRGGPTIESFPQNGRMQSANSSMVADAQSYIASMPRRFGGGTPTQNALVRALNLKPEAVILLSDGAPDDGSAGTIVRNITNRNRGRAEIHTVAIGDYTQDKRLTLFLQELANRNRGDFVGRAR